MANKNLNAAKTAKKDEFYTQMTDIERELQHYWPHFRDNRTISARYAARNLTSNLWRVTTSHLGAKEAAPSSRTARCCAGNVIEEKEVSNQKGINMEKRILLFVFVLLMPLMGRADYSRYSYEIDGLYYNLDGDMKQARVAYGNYKGLVTIPSSIKYNDITYRVTEIGYQAFWRNSELSSVYIPNTVTYIGEGAFYECTGLTYIIIPNSVTYIGQHAFSGCTGLTYIIIPNSVTDIRSNAFYGCSGLTSLTIGSGLTTIERCVFQKCSNLTSIEIPNSVTAIGEYAFSECSSLTEVIIPNSVTSIGGMAFYCCSGLTSVTIGNSVTEIGYSAFSSCSNLTSVSIPNSVTEIGTSAFRECSNLTKVELNSNAVASKTHNLQSNLLYIFGPQVKEYIIGEDVTAIGNYAFYGCSEMTSVTFGNGMTTIGAWAFNGCSGLTSVEIPNSMKEISVAAFIRCYNLSSIIIPNSVTIIGESAFESTAWYNNQPDGLVYAGKVAYKYKGTMPANTSMSIEEGTVSISNRAFGDCYGMISVAIPNSVTAIGNYAFYYCTKLKSVTIPNNVTSVGEAAFWNCASLTSVTVGSGVTTIEEDAFQGCSSLQDLYCYTEEVPNTSNSAFSNVPIPSATLYVPAGSMENYKDTEPWSGFGSIVALDESVRGDANGDGEIGMPDVMFVVNCILGNPAETFNEKAADANLDGEIGMPDVMFIVNYILNGKFPDEE